MAGSADGPEKFGVLGLGSSHDRSVCENDLDGKEIVYDEPVLSREPTVTSS